MWQLGIFLIVWTFTLAGQAWAARVDLHSSLNLGAGYVRVVDRDVPGDPLEAVAIREGVRNTVTFDNAYIHVGLGYEVSAVQLRRNSDLNYLDHRLAIDVNPERWLRRVTPTGHLTIIADLTINPSLPPIQSATPTSPTTDPGTLPADGGAAGPSEPPLPQLPGVDNLLTVREDRSGYVAHYGLGWEEALTSFSSYRAAAAVTDHRYRNSAVPDVATLQVTAEYLTHLEAGQAGFGVSHQRFVRGGFFNQKSYGLFVSLSRSGRLFGWRVAPGVAYRTDPKRYGATLEMSGFIRRRILTYTGNYGVGYAFLDVGSASLAPVQSVGLSIHPTQEVRFSSRLGAGARFSSNTTEYALALTQRADFTPTLNATVRYERALRRWETAANPSLHQQYADTVWVALIWLFL